MLEPFDMMFICLIVRKHLREILCACAGFRDDGVKLIYFKQLRKGREVKNVLTIHAFTNHRKSGWRG